VVHLLYGVRDAVALALLVPLESFVGFTSGVGTGVRSAETVDVAGPVVRVVEHRKLGVLAGLLSDSTWVLGTLAIFRILVVDHDGIFGIIAHGTSAFFVNAFASAQALWAIDTAVTVWLATFVLVRVIQHRVRFSTLLLSVRATWVAFAHACFLLCVPARDRMLGVFAFGIFTSFGHTLPSKCGDDQRCKGNHNEQFHSGK